MPYRADEDAAVARADALQVELDVAHRKLAEAEGKLATAEDAERKLAETEEALAETASELARHRHDDPIAETPVVRVDAEPVVEAPAPAAAIQRSSTPAPPVVVGPRPQAGALLAIVLILAVLAGIVVAIVAFATS